MLDPAQYPQWQRDYVALLTQRDLPNWGLPARPEVTIRLARMLAAVHGQVWNATQLGQSLGLTYKTVNSYLDYLVGAFLIRRLPSYQANIRKRLIKNPKVYWRDSGLLHALLNVPDWHALLSHPLVGASWEGFVIEQTLGALSAAGRRFDAYHFRTSDQRELDLVLDFGKDLWAIEVKITASPTTEDMERLNQTADLIGATRRILVSNTAKPTDAGARISCNLPALLDYLTRSLAQG